ncbi:MAG: hypothetical protein ACI9W4_002998 [Rhodothermales bacterium]|jgi:hypothetical protein
MSSSRVGDGSASLGFRVVEEDGMGTTGSQRLRCVDVLILNPESYSDTLAFGRVKVRSAPGGHVETARPLVTLSAVLRSG